MVKECVQRVIGALQGCSKQDLLQMSKNTGNLHLNAENVLTLSQCFLTFRKGQNQIDHLVAGLKCACSLNARNIAGIPTMLLVPY